MDYRPEPRRRHDELIGTGQVFLASAKQHSAAQAETNFFPAETQHTGVAEAAYRPIINSRSQRLRGVVDDANVSLSSEFDDCFDISRITKEMGHDNRAGFSRQCRSKRFNGDIKFGAHVGEYGNRTHGQNRRNHRAATKRRQDHLVARLNLTCAQGQFESEASRAAEQRVL